MSQPLSITSSFPRRFGAWILERFPPPAWIVFGILYLACSVLAQAAMPTNVNYVIDIGVKEILGALSAIAFFLLLRILDEHKDFEKDNIYNAHRILQRGLITLGHLKALAVVWGLFIAAFCFYADQGVGKTFVGFLIVVIWVSLMTKEFFVAEWLNKHLILYGVSHMLVMPLVMLWFFISSVPTLEVSETLLWLGAMAFFNGFCLEFTRKTKGAEEEKEGVDTYSSLLGRGRSSFVSWCMGAMEQVCKLMLIMSLPLNGNYLPYEILFGALVLIFGASFLVYLKNPVAAGRKRNEMLAGLCTLISYIAIFYFVAKNYQVDFMNF